MAHSSADSINHFIENGQPLDAIRLAHTFSLTDKYPPLAIMNDYIENAKKTAEDILSKESYTLESLVCSVSWKGCLVMLIQLKWNCPFITTVVFLALRSPGFGK